MDLHFIIKGLAYFVNQRIINDNHLCFNDCTDLDDFKRLVDLENYLKGNGEKHDRSLIVSFIDFFLDDSIDYCFDEDKKKINEFIKPISEEFLKAREFCIKHLDDFSNKIDVKGSKVTIMSDGNIFSKVKNTLLEDGQELAVRQSAKQLVKMVQEPMVAGLAKFFNLENDDGFKSKIGFLLQSEFGFALVSFLCSVGIGKLPIPILPPGMMQHLSRELRLQSENIVMEPFVEMVTEPLRKALTQQVLSFPIAQFHTAPQLSQASPELVEASPQVDPEGPVKPSPKPSKAPSKTAPKTSKARPKRKKVAVVTESEISST